MDKTAITPLRAFTASVDFLSGDEHFATERFRTEASDDRLAHATARAQAEASPYANQRIPDLRFIITLAPGGDVEGIAPGGDVEGAGSDPGDQTA